MRIGEIAKQTGLNISNIRFYERKGLLRPDRNADSKYREYTEEDVAQIKRILLYRKMGISIETIYLLLNGQANSKDVLLRQQDILVEEINNLTGSLNLCQMILKEGNFDLDEDQIDKCLNFVSEEEEKGVRFAEAKELLEDITDYTRDNVFYKNPIGLWFYSYPWIPTVLTIVFWLMMLSVPCMHLFDVYRGQDDLSVPLLVIYFILLISCFVGFLKYRKYKKKHIQLSDSERTGEYE